MANFSKIRGLALGSNRGLLSLASSLAIVLLLLIAGPTAQAQSFSVIHQFTAAGDGANPDAGVTVRAGILYGTAYRGGSGNGSVYQITHSGSTWVTTAISLLSSGGANPIARVVYGPDGHPYGTTENGGAAGKGIVFDLIIPVTICKSANCFWKENVLYDFLGSADAANPGYGDLTWDAQGNIYGTTMAGGASGDGAVYELQRSGNSWTESVIYNFSGPDGVSPQSGVIFDKSGNLFGTTVHGGAQGDGHVYELKYTQGVGWTENTVYDFQNGSDGAHPVAGLIFDGSGNLYGATSDGGSQGGGTVFELSPSGDSWTYKLLYSFSGPANAGCGPWGNLAMDAAGNLYGTTNCDGAYVFGSVFKLTNTGNGWTYSSLHSFSGYSDGAFPFGNLTFDTSGNLYGTAYYGGTFGGNCGDIGCGVVWMITP